MTNKRIAALSAATTPLAGTELVPIWDGSTTVYVTVANLTAGRAIATGQITTSDAIRLEYSTPKIWTKHTGSAVTANMAMNMSSSNNTVYWQIGINQAVGEGFEINAGAATNNRMYIDPTTGAMKIPYGLGIGNTAGGAGGIAFPATAVAVADANTLDDYEEGTWTGAFVATTSGTISIGYLGNYDKGSYTKVGRLVTVTGDFYVPSVSVPVGSLRLTGLPFTCSNSIPAYSGVVIYPIDLAVAAVTSIVGNVVANTTYIVISKYSAGTSSNLAGDVVAGSEFRISASYITD